MILVQYYTKNKSGGNLNFRFDFYTKEGAERFDSVNTTFWKVIK